VGELGVGDRDRDGVEARAPPHLPVSSDASSNASIRSPLEAPDGASLVLVPRLPDLFSSRAGKGESATAGTARVTAVPFRSSTRAATVGEEERRGLGRRGRTGIGE
jgi:hypothetical protein